MERSHLDIGWFGPVDGRWMGLLDHFSCIEVLDRATAREWLQEPSSDRSLLVGLEHRSDDRLAWLLDLASKPRVEGAKKKSTAEPFHCPSRSKRFIGTSGMIKSSRGCAGSRIHRWRVRMVCRAALQGD
jgi:hypothetical protein